jgi:hypothetical protein
MGELLVVRNQMRDVDIAGVSAGKYIFANLVSGDDLAEVIGVGCGIPIDEAVIHPEFDDEVDQLLLDVRAIFVVVAPVDGLQADAAGID